MKKSLIIPILVLILTFLLLGCNKNQKLNSFSATTPEPKAEIQQKSISILRMTDLEIIKKSSDYLKACGKSLVFEETQILYENTMESSPICKDMDNQDVYYDGSYLIVYFYPHDQLGEGQNTIAVYIGEGGKVLGYREDENSRG